MPEVFVGSKVILPMTETAWSALGKGEHWQVITQLYLRGAIDVCASLIQRWPDGKQFIGAAGTLESLVIHKIGPRLSLDALTALILAGRPEIVLEEFIKTYNDPPIQVKLISD